MKRSMVRRKEQRNVFRQLQRSIDNGTYWMKFPVGTVLPDIWGSYDMPLRVVNYGEVVLASGEKRFGATLLRVNAIPGSIQFNWQNYKIGQPRGNNRFGDSHVWWYLNSDSCLCGYLDYCSEELLDALTEVAVVYLNDGGAEEQVKCRFFLPKSEELHVDRDELEEGEIDRLTWEYFRDTPTDWEDHCEERIFRTPDGVERACWLGSVKFHKVETVFVDGCCYTDEPYAGHNAVAPACAITGCRAADSKMHWLIEPLRKAVSWSRRMISRVCRVIHGALYDSDADVIAFGIILLGLIILTVFGVYGLISGSFGN